jgi:alpha-amylase/alpha-mannosidase (GH57 family)
VSLPPFIIIAINIVVLARIYNLNNFVCFRFTSLEHGNTVYNATIQTLAKAARRKKGCSLV